jgi:preprotein translocase subunit YajC
MFITPAFAQAAGGGAGGMDQLTSFLFPILLVLPIFYFLIIRPQNKRLKDHQDMVGAIRRGDTVVTAGGIIGKVTKVLDDKTITVEIADNVRIQVVRTTISEVRAKGEPAAANDGGPKAVTDRADNK